jgi:hypothetical protein
MDSATGSEKMIEPMSYALLLRFRDLVTEPGGNIAEHRRIIRQRGYAWWGWWSRQREAVPRTVFGQLFAPEAVPTPILLFDSGMMRMYKTSSGKAVVAPSHVGVNSPEYDATPEYYVRGRYPAWFRLDSDIVAVEASSVMMAARPTLDAGFESLKADLPLVKFDFDALRDDGATLWVVTLTEDA